MLMSFWFDPEKDQSGDRGDESDNEGDDTGHEAFQRQVRLNATQRAKGNRRTGGLRTQRAMRKERDVSLIIIIILTHY